MRPLDEIFDIIDKENYFTVEQTTTLKLITPNEYKDLFNIEEKFYNENIIAAGIFGFKNTPEINNLLNKLHNTSLMGLCLGFSPNEQWKNKGLNKNQFIRNCEMFRHDTTLLNLILIKYLGDFKKHDSEKYGNPDSPNKHPQQLIWNMRMNYIKLRYLDNYKYVFYK